MAELAYTLKRPENWVNGVIIASPHSGSDYPGWFLDSTSLPINLLRSSEDAFVDRLIERAPEMGAVTLLAHMPRCMIDLNRGAEEIDPLVVQGIPRHPLNQRTLAGLGVIPRVVSQGRTIYKQPLARAEAERRIGAYWRPYHRALASLITEAQERFGRALLIDMHSMPREALTHLPHPRPDIVLGNRHGLSAAGRVLDAAAHAFEVEGFSVRLNSPFSGAYICQAYGRPGKGTHVIQVEINRELYMNEVEITPNRNFGAISARIARVIQNLIGRDTNGNADSVPIAAE